MRLYLEGKGDLVGWFRMGITRAAIWLIGVIRILTESLTIQVGLTCGYRFGLPARPCTRLHEIQAYKIGTAFN